MKVKMMIAALIAMVIMMGQTQAQAQSLNPDDPIVSVDLSLPIANSQFSALYNACWNQACRSPLFLFPERIAFSRTRDGGNFLITNGYQRALVHAKVLQVEPNVSTSAIGVSLTNYIVEMKIVPVPQPAIGGPVSAEFMKLVNLMASTKRLSVTGRIQVIGDMVALKERISFNNGLVLNSK